LAVAATYGSVNLPLWKMKFAPKGKFTPSYEPLV